MASVTGVRRVRAFIQAQRHTLTFCWAVARRPRRSAASSVASAACRWATASCSTASSATCRANMLYLDIIPEHDSNVDPRHCWIMVLDSWTDIHSAESFFHRMTDHPASEPYTSPHCVRMLPQHTQIYLALRLGGAQGLGLAAARVAHVAERLHDVRLQDGDVAVPLVQTLLQLPRFALHAAKAGSLMSLCSGWLMRSNSRVSCR